MGVLFTLILKTNRSIDASTPILIETNANIIVGGGNLQSILPKS